MTINNAGKEARTTNKLYQRNTRAALNEPRVILKLQKQKEKTKNKPPKTASMGFIASKYTNVTIAIKSPEHTKIQSVTSAKVAILSSGGHKPTNSSLWSKTLNYGLIMK